VGNYERGIFFILTFGVVSKIGNPKVVSVWFPKREYRSGFILEEDKVSL
jgi:hypothetical protein